MKSFNYRKLVLAIADVFIIVVSGILTNYILSLLNYKGIEASRSLLYNIVITLILCGFALFASGAYSRLWRFFNKKDYISCAIAMLVGFALAYVVMQVLMFAPDIVFDLLYFVIATVGVLAFRFIFKKSFLNLTEAGSLDKRERTLIVGAGNAGRMIVTEIENAQFDVNNSARNILPVCFVDDDITKLRTKIKGVEVVGTCPEIPRICTDYHIENIIVALPSCDEEDKRRLFDYCSATEC